MGYSDFQERKDETSPENALLYSFYQSGYFPKPLCLSCMKRGENWHKAQNGGAMNEFGSSEAEGEGEKGRFFLQCIKKANVSNQ